MNHQKRQHLGQLLASGLAACADLYALSAGPTIALLNLNIKSKFC